MSRCYKCGRAYRPGEQAIGIMARPSSWSELKEHYHFSSKHHPQCPENSKQLLNRKHTLYDGSKITRY